MPVKETKSTVLLPRFRHTTLHVGAGESFNYLYSFNSEKMCLPLVYIGALSNPPVEIKGIFSRIAQTWNWVDHSFITSFVFY
jgi:hypothetical protein